MAPVKFEDNLKETLEKRTISPSSDAWSRLQNRLDESKEKKSNKRFWMLGLAASVVGVLLVTTLFLKSDDIDSINNEIKIVQETPAIELNEQEGTSIVLEDKKNETQFLKANTQVESEIAHENVSEKKFESQKKAIEQPVVVDLAAVSENHIEEEIKSFEDIKVDEVVAQVQKLVSINQSVTEQEIDSLLNIAQLEINQQRIYNETTGKVDAMALLQGVENDLDKSFRNRVLETLISSVESVATAVAQRNN